MPKVLKERLQTGWKLTLPKETHGEDKGQWVTSCTQKDFILI